MSDSSSSYTRLFSPIVKTMVVLGILLGVETVASSLITREGYWLIVACAGLFAVAVGTAVLFAVTENRPLLLTAVAFALLGPLLGFLALLGCLLGAEAISDASGAWRGMDIEMAGIMLTWAYALATLPAGMVGLVWGITFLRMDAERRLRAFGRALIGATIGGLAGLLAGLVWDVLSTTRLESPQLYAAFAPLGAFAAAVLASLLPPRRWLSAAPDRCPANG